MQTLRMLGTIALSSADGTEIDALLRQPKSVALLAYLTLPRPGTWHRRDVLLATFWPELTQSAARAALRSALHLLRRHLAEGTIRTRGDDEVGVDPALLATDAGVMLDDIDRGDLVHALDRYRGDLLPGLYIADSPEFERWLETERTRLSAAAFRTAASLADVHERDGALTLAIAAAARSAELSPYDESAVRRWIALLGRTDDRAQALAVYERFRQRIASELGTEPSPQTVALAEEIRRRSTSAKVSDAPRPDASIESAAISDVPSRSEELAPHALTRPAVVSGRGLAIVLGASIAFVAVFVSIAYIQPRTELVPRAASARSVTHRLVLLPVEGNAVGSTSEYLASGVEYGIARRLERIQAVGVRLASRAELRAAATVVDPAASFGKTVLVRVTLDTMSDSVSARASLIDSASRREREVLSRRLPRAELRDVESQIATAIVGELHHVGLPFGLRQDDRPVDPEAYRLTILGYHQLITLGDDSAAFATFVRATLLDPLYPRAWSGLASVWGLRTVSNTVSFDEGYRKTASAAARALALDSTQGSALASLAMVTALKYRQLAAGAPLFRRAMRYEPSNPEVFVIASFTNRYLHRWDDARDLVRVARQLDPLSLRYPANEARVELCADRPEAAERVYREAIDAEPENADARDGLVRSLALQGKFDAALDAWRASPARKTPAALVAALADAHGRSGYYEARHVEGRLRLDAYRRARAGLNVARLRLVSLQLQAGDSAAGFAGLDSAVQERAEWLFRIPCFQPLDEYRTTPRYKALLARVGVLPAR